MGAVDKYPRSQCLSCNKLETLISRLIDATEKHKPSQAVASEANSLSPRLQRRAQSSSDVVNYTTQPPLPVPGSTPYQHRQPGPQHDFTKGMSTSFGPTHSAGFLLTLSVRHKVAEGPASLVVAVIVC